MKSILSQNEVDELLSDFQDEPPYCETEQDRTLTKEDLKMLRRLHESLSDDLSDKLGTLMHTEVALTLLQIKTRRGPIMQMSDRSVVSGCFAFDLPQQKGCYTLDMKLVYSLVERLLGGDGMSMYYASELTEIEQRFYAKIDDAVLGALQAKWTQHKSASMIKKIACDDEASPREVITVVMQVSAGVKGQLQFHYELPFMLN